MREMMRNSDRAMSYMENHPEGFSMLRRMYTNVQEPMMNASMPQNNPFASLFPNQQIGGSAATPPPTNPNTNPLPNPWAPASPTPPSTAPTTGTTTTGATGPASTNPPFMSDPFGMNMDPNMMASLMQDPGVQGMMQQVFSNPELMEQMMASNPMAQQMMNANPAMRSMMQNPELLRSLSNPQTVNALLQMQNAMQQLQGNDLFSNIWGMPGQPQLPSSAPATPPTASSTAPPSTTPASSAAPPNWAQMFSMMGMAPPTGAIPTGVPTQPAQTPEERFSTQLQQLQEMGFINNQENIAALQMTGGNVQAAIERLLSR